MAGRPRLTLLERVLEDSFRPGRYAHLLIEDELPTDPPDDFEPWPDEWLELVTWQMKYRLAENTLERQVALEAFSKTVGALHGRPLQWYAPPRVDGLTKALPTLDRMNAEDFPPGTIGVVTGENARYTAFTQALVTTARPPGTSVLFTATG